MKRFLKHDQYQMTDAERETLWYAVRRQTHGAVDRSAPTRATFRPALTLAAVTAVMTLMITWHIGSRQILQRGADDARDGAAVDVAALTRNAPGPASAAQEAPQTRGMAKSTEAPVQSQGESASPDKSIPTNKSGSLMKSDPPGRASPAGEARPTTPESTTDNGAETATEIVTLLPTVAGEIQPAADPATDAMVRAVGATAPILTGRVTDRDSGTPLAGVLVLVRGTTMSATTDSLGQYRFPTLSAGNRADLTILASGYRPAGILVALPENGAVVRDVALARLTVALADGPGDHQEPRRDAIVREGGDVTTGRLEGKGGAGAADVRPLPMAVAPRNSPRMAAGRAWGWPGSVTGGSTPPNGEPFELMYFENVGVNPFVATEDDALSTFAVDVDDASWTMARSYLSRGHLPPRDAIRVEEFVNAFDAGWPRPTAQPLRIHVEGTASRFGDGYHLLRIGLAGRTVAAAGRKPADLVFVIDVSGSMARESRLGTVKRALHALLDQLEEGDRVGIVTYGSRGEVRLPLTIVEHREEIAAVIDGLQTGGSTNAAEGLDLAYRMARDGIRPDVVSRLILCSDGVANNGFSTEAGAILDQVRQASDVGITLSAVGFGMGNYNDVLMEKLADQGDGNYAYVDSRAEADRIFRENLTGRLQTIAREAKVQVEFDPAYVRRWRLLGYENRDVADEDFRNDAVDAGEIGAGHQVTALYELRLEQPAVAGGGGADAARRPAPADDVRIGTVRLRYEAPAHDAARAGQVTEVAQPILRSQFAPDADVATPWHQVQALAAEFAEVLRGSYWARESDLASLVPLGDALAARLPGDPRVRDLAGMIRLAAEIAGRQEE